MSSDVSRTWTEQPEDRNTQDMRNVTDRDMKLHLSQKVGQTRPGQNRPRKNRHGQSRPGQTRTRKAWANQDKPGMDKPGQARSGQTRPTVQDKHGQVA